MTPPSETKIVCECLKVTEAQLVMGIQRLRPRSVEDIADANCAGEGCMACHPLLAQYLQRIHSIDARAA